MCQPALWWLFHHYTINYCEWHLNREILLHALLSLLLIMSMQANMLNKIIIMLLFSETLSPQCLYHITVSAHNKVCLEFLLCYIYYKKCIIVGFVWIKYSEKNLFQFCQLHVNFSQNLFRLDFLFLLWFWLPHLILHNQMKRLKVSEYWYILYI